MVSQPQDRLTSCRGLIHSNSRRSPRTAAWAVECSALEEPATPSLASSSAHYERDEDRRQRPQLSDGPPSRPISRRG